MASDEVVAKTYKIVLVGEYATGKTSIIRRFTQDQFSLSTQSTIGENSPTELSFHFLSNALFSGVDFKPKVVEIDGL